MPIGENWGGTPHPLFSEKACWARGLLNQRLQNTAFKGLRGKIPETRDLRPVHLRFISASLDRLRLEHVELVTDGGQGWMSHGTVEMPGGCRLLKLIIRTMWEAARPLARGSIS